MSRRANELTTEQKLSQEIISANLSLPTKKSDLLKVIDGYITNHLKHFGLKTMDRYAAHAIAISLFRSVSINFPDKARLQRKLAKLDQPKGENRSLTVFISAVNAAFAVDELFGHLQEMRNGNPDLP